jgi:hypothetical protein
MLVRKVKGDAVMIKIGIKTDISVPIVQSFQAVNIKMPV